MAMCEYRKIFLPINAIRNFLRYEDEKVTPKQSCFHNNALIFVFVI